MYNTFTAPKASALLAEEGVCPLHNVPLFVTFALP